MSNGGIGGFSEFTPGEEEDDSGLYSFMDDFQENTEGYGYDLSDMQDLDADYWDDFSTWLQEDVEGRPEDERQTVNIGLGNETDYEYWTGGNEAGFKNWLYGQPPEGTQEGWDWGGGDHWYRDQWLNLLSQFDDDIGWGEAEITRDEAEARYPQGIMREFSNWVGRGPEDWTQADWEAYSQLSESLEGSGGYGGGTYEGETLETQFDAMMTQAGLNPDDYRAYMNDPRFWNMMQEFAGDAGLSGITSIVGGDGTTWDEDERKRFYGLDLPGGALGYGDLEYTPSNVASELHVPEGTWSYEEPPQAPERPEGMWGTTQESGQEYVDYLRDQWEYNPSEMNWNNYQESLVHQELHNALVRNGADPSLANSILARIESEDGSIYTDPYVRRLLNFGVDTEDPADITWQEAAGGITSPGGALADVLGVGYANPWADILTGAIAGEPEEEVLEGRDSFDAWIANNPTLGTSDDFWVYGPAYEQWLLEEKYGGLGTPEYYEELRVSKENQGARRTGAPGRWDAPEQGYQAGWEGDPDWVGPSSTLPGFGSLDPFAMAGQGMYAPGLLYDEDQSWMNDPWAASWGLPQIDYGDFRGLSEEDKNEFLRADQFFQFLNEDAEERGALDADGNINLADYWAIVERDEDAAYLEELQGDYNYYGQQWDRIAPLYYPAAQEHANTLAGGVDQSTRVEDLRRALIPHAQQVADMTGQSLEDTLAFLTGTGTGAGFAGGTEDAGEQGVAGVTTGGTATGSSATTGTTAAVVGNTQSGSSIDYTDAENTANNATVENKQAYEQNQSANSFSPPISTGYMDIFSGAQPGTMDSRADFMQTVGNTAFNASKIGGLSGGKGEQVQIPNFVLDAAASGTSSVDPISYWNGLSRSDKDAAMKMAKSENLDTGMSSYDNPDYDLYRTDSSGTTTEFYLPAWAVELAYPQMDSLPETLSGPAFQGYEGVVPDYSWWQSIGSKNRLDLQENMQTAGEDTRLVSVRKLVRRDVEGKDVGEAFVPKEFDMSSGIPEAIWADKTDVNRLVESETALMREPVTFTDFVRWSIEASGGAMDPLEIMNGEVGYANVSNYDIPRASLGAYMENENFRGATSTGAIKNFTRDDLDSVRHAIGIENALIEDNFTAVMEASHQPYNERERAHGFSHNDLDALWGLGGPEKRDKMGQELFPPISEREFRAQDRGADGISLGAYGGFSKTAWNYFLNNYDGYVGEENARAVPLPVGVTRDELSQIRADGGTVNGQILFDPNFDSTMTVNHYGDIGSSSFGSITLDMDDFFRSFQKEVNRPSELLREGENFYSEGGGDRVEKADRPFYYNDGTSRQQFWGALSLFTPLYEEYLGSYDKAAGDAYAEPFEDFVTAQVSEMPEYNAMDPSGTFNRSLAFQQKAAVEYESYVNTLRLIPNWQSGAMVREGVGYQSGHFGISNETRRDDDPYADYPGTWVPQGFIFYNQDWSDRIDAPSHEGHKSGGIVGYAGGGSLGGPLPWLEEENRLIAELKEQGFSGAELEAKIREARGNRAGIGSLKEDKGKKLEEESIRREMEIERWREENPGALPGPPGLPQLRMQEGGMVPPSGIASVSPIRNQGGLESMVQSDPLLQELVSVLMSGGQDPRGVMQMAIAKYGDELIRALARIVSQSSGSQGMYIPGAGGGMEDDVPATIDGSEPAALSSGEFVVPADVVAHLGDGNNENGASKLDGMMDRVRVNKTGNIEQPEEIAEEQVLPA